MEDSPNVVDSEKPRAVHARIPISRLGLDILFLLCILSMVLWPWGVFAVLRASGGIQMPNSLAEYIVENPQLVSAFVTFVGTLNRIAATFLFGCAITRYGQESIATKVGNEAVTVFDWKALEQKPRRCILVVLFFVVLGGFATIPSGTASLVAPSRFHKSQMMELTGWELDFTVQDPQCASWLGESGRFPSGWCRQMVQDTAAPDSELFALSAPPGICLSESKMLDIFDSGRGNMLASNETYKLLPRLLSTEAGVPFLGSARGVLPLGPNSIPTLKGMWNSSGLFNNSRARRGVLSYNYTIPQQGLGNHVRCAYTDTSPIVFDAGAAWNDLWYDVACGNGQTSVFDSPGAGNNTQNGLAFMACEDVTAQSPETEDPVYYIYLRGGKGPGYSTFVGNITCMVSPMRSEIFSVTYRGGQAYFTTDIVNPGPLTAASNSTHPAFIRSSTHLLGELVSWAQRWNSNMVAESVATVGVKLFNISQAERDPRYLPLYEATIQGVLEYVATYFRIHLLQQNPPTSCYRMVEGSVDYTVMGWSTQTSYVQIAFLLPMTILNLTTLVILLTAMRMGGLRYEHDFEPTDTRSLLGASVGDNGSREGDDSTAKVDWGDRVTYRVGTA
ncbi:hypothetical protein H1R20_g824, partial [Candolleomyces eurysporus]